MKASLSLTLIILPVILLQACAASLQDFTTDKKLSIGDSEITPWPKSVEETSGLAQRKGLLWTLNDSGDGPYIYALNQKGLLVKKVHIANGHNFDFEELASDQQYLYVADIGDNFAQRNELIIYRLAWQAIDKAEHHGSVKAELIKIQLEDTSKFKHKHSHNYDFEALAVKGDELWLFSKNRLDGNSELYRLPKQPGEYTLAVSSSYPVKGLITAADIHPDSKQAVLLGYQIHSGSFASYLWLAPVTADGLDWSKAQSIEIQPGGQWEAVIWAEDGKSLVISREDNHQGAVAVAKIKS